MRLSLRDTVKFGILVGFAAIFMDAAIAHGLWWENDPYWTYWITKTFLIITIFTIGTGFLGIGIVPGLITTAVHTLVLEIYYQWLAPIGLPQEPWWLEQRDLWLPGFFVHYLAILSGYQISFWVWLRSQRRLQIEIVNVVSNVLLAFVAAVAVLVVDGVITQGILLQSFPGWTFFLQHLLIAFVFLVAWSTFVGFDTKGIFAAALLLSLVWTTYSMYLGPVGLPTELPKYLGYNELWLKSFPGAFISIFVSLWLLSKAISLSMRHFVKSIVFILLTVSLLFPQSTFAADLNPIGGRMAVSARTTETGKMVVGSDPYNLNNTQDMEGSIAISAVDVGNRWSHIQNIDEMNVVANFQSGDSSYKVTIDKAMQRHPLGRYATWMGVALNHSMHGKTGIGTDKVPEVKPEIALWGYAQVERDGQVIAKMAPAHVMVMTKEPLKGIALEVDAEDKTLRDIPNGYVHVMWSNIDSITLPTRERENRELFGWVVLIGINAIFWYLIQQERVTPILNSSRKATRK